MKRLLLILLVFVMLLSLAPMALASEEAANKPEAVFDGAAENINDYPSEDPSDEIVEEPVEEPLDEPAGEPLDEPAEEPLDEPAEEPALDGLVASGTCGKNLSWTLTNDGTLTISGEGKMYGYISFDPAPWYEQKDEIRSVFIEEGVTDIGGYAFYECRNLTNVVISEGVESIESMAFRKCTSHESITIPSSVSKIGENAFSSTPWLESQGDLVIINTILYAYRGRDSILEIPDYVTSICEDAFSIQDPQSDMLSMMSNWPEYIKIPASLTDIPRSQPFSYCRFLKGIFVDDNNPSYKSVDGVLFSKDMSELVAFPVMYNSRSYTIPEGVELIGVKSFLFNETLRTVIIPHGVKKIGYQTFDCSNITEIYIPVSVQAIDITSFRNNSQMDIYYAGNEEQWNSIERWWSVYLAVSESQKDKVEPGRDYATFSDETIEEAVNMPFATIHFMVTTGTDPAAAPEPAAEPPTVTISDDAKTAMVTGDISELYARVALVLDNNGESGLYITQGMINTDGTIVIPVFDVPGLTVTGVNIALVKSIADITSASPVPVAMDYKYY